VNVLRPEAALAEAPQFVRAAAPVTAKEAFEDSYGQLMVNELHKALLKGAEPICLADRRITADRLRDAGEEMLIRYGQGIADKMMEVVDAKAADQEFARRGGANALAELGTLLKDPAVLELIRLSRPGDRDRLVDQTTDMFDQYVSLNRIKLDRINPVATGSYVLEKRRIDDSDGQAEEFIGRSETPALRRYLELVEAAIESLQAATDRNQLARYGPNQMIQGLDIALSAVCIVVR
jgi:hypothetical protein